MNASRKGDISEHQAVAWLLNQGYEVFKNTGCTGPADIVIWDVETNEFTPVDVKRGHRYIRKDGVVTVNFSCREAPDNVRFLVHSPDDNSFFWADEA